MNLKRLIRDILLLIKSRNSYIIISKESSGQLLVSHTLEGNKIKDTLSKTLIIFSHLCEYKKDDIPVPDHSD